jgi:hypothetical protein
MIQLATDPNASRGQWRPAAAQAGQASPVSPRRTGHAWPFISRYGELTPAPQELKRPPKSEGGS